MKFTDEMVLDGALRRDSKGNTVAFARVARANNVQTYAGTELGLTDREFVRVFRPEASVFDRKSFESYARAPITLGHPPSGKVTPDNWRDEAVGEIDSDGLVRDGEYVRVPLVIRDAKAVQTIEAGTVQLSMGYDAQLSLVDGVSPSGEPYDAVMTDLVMNHVAVVPNARGGKELRIGDGALEWGIRPVTIQTADTKGRLMPDTLRKVLVDGLQVETTDAGAQAIDKLSKAVSAADTALADAKAEHDKAIAVKDAELAKKDAEIAELKGKVLSDADLDAKVQARADLVDTAKKVAPKVETKGLSDADIRKAAVAAVRGEDAIKDKSAAYIDAAFDLLVESSVKPNDAARDAIRNGIKPVGDAAVEANDAYGKSVDDLNAWRKEA